MTLELLYSRNPVPYREAYERQKQLHSRRVAGEIPDSLWLLEHPPVITTGIRKDQSTNILIDPSRVGAELVETERGGEVTYHGPGQLVGYLFVGIENHGYKVKNFVKKLESAFISYLNSAFAIEARHDDEHTGVWVGMDKITAIGIALRQKVTLHGFAFNVNTNLSHFDWIVPCGIADVERSVTSLEKLLHRKLEMEQVARDVGNEVARTLGYEPGEFHAENP